MSHGFLGQLSRSYIPWLLCLKWAANPGGRRVSPRHQAGWKAGCRLKVCPTNSENQLVMEVGNLYVRHFVKQGG
jgi:hypothetical protein